MYKIITISGSMQHWDEILNQATRLSIEGNIVLIPFKNPDENNIPESRKNMYDEVHNERIDMSDELFVVNKNGYVGNSTRKELLYAIRNKKHVEFLERPTVQYIGNILLAITHFQRIDILKHEFETYLVDLISTMYYHHLLSIDGKYDFVTSTQSISKIQTDLDMLFQITKHCLGANEEVTDENLHQMYQPSLDQILDNIEDYIDLDEFKFQYMPDRYLHLAALYKKSWTMEELIYSTPSELIAVLGD